MCDGTHLSVCAIIDDKTCRRLSHCSQVSFSYSPDTPIFKRISLYADMESRIALVRGVASVKCELDVKNVTSNH